MSTELSPKERLASIVDAKPLYVAQHGSAALALVQLVDYDDWCVLDAEWLLAFLHELHLCVDGLVQEYGFYKVGFQSGAFTVAANISNDVNPHATERMLQFATEVLRALRDKRLPQGGAPRTRISLSTGPVRSAILGKTALKYTVHGRPEVIARLLLKSHGRDGSIIATKRQGRC